MDITGFQTRFHAIRPTRPFAVRMAGNTQPPQTPPPDVNQPPNFRHITLPSKSRLYSNSLMLALLAVGSSNITAQSPTISPPVHDVAPHDDNKTSLAKTLSKTMEEKLTAFTDQMQEKFNKLEAKLQDLQAKAERADEKAALLQLQAQVATMEHEVETIACQFTEQDYQTQNRQAELEQVQKTAATDHSALDALHQKVSALEGRISLDQLDEIVKTVTPSTVFVQGPNSIGSGVLLQDGKGKRFILTNGHVTTNNAYAQGLYHIQFYNGTDEEKRPSGNFPLHKLANGTLAQSPMNERDLALLAIPDDYKLPSTAKPVRLRDLAKDPLAVGEAVVAVGNPHNIMDSVSMGIASHINRKFDMEPKNRFIQTDAAINPGNSGGGLFDLQGRLIGINTLNVKEAQSIAGAIRLDQVHEVLKGWGVDLTAPVENNTGETKPGETQAPPPPAEKKAG